MILLSNQFLGVSTPLNALDPNDPSHKEIERRILRQPQLPKQPELHLHIVIPNEFRQFGKKKYWYDSGYRIYDTTGRVDRGL